MADPQRSRRDVEHRPATVLPLFAVLWAVAAVFHVWVNPRAIGFVDDPSLVGATHIALLAAAIAVLVRPAALAPLAVLCAAVVGSAYAEAPFLGNHWLLSALVSLAFIGAVAGGGAPVVVAARFVPAARATLLVFYAFAAFSKLNGGFFSTVRSCAVFFFDQSADSWGVPWVTAGTGWAPLVIGATVLTELSIPVLLLVRRTRTIGVAVAVAFHFVLALDRTHPFADFSAGLAALFILFLPASFAAHAAGLARRVPRWAWLVAGAGAAVVTAALVVRPSQASLRWLDEGRDILWFGYGAAVLVVVAGWVFTTRPQSARRGVAVGMGWLGLVPALAVLNGVAPYVEVKTGYSWNMYANLVTAGGESNHFVVRRTFPLTGEQDELVTVLASTDPGLRWYAATGWRLAPLQFRAYLADHPEASVRYRRAGVEHELARAADDPALVEPVPPWRQKLQLFRAVDSLDPPRCQNVWGPAR